ncbi:DUF167 domain-containing protein [Nanoarchaeota archaeon]
MKLQIRVKPNSKEQSVEKVKIDKDGESEEIYYVKLKSPADEGQANMELIKLLSKHFGKEVRIKSGFRSRNKVVEVF